MRHPHQTLALVALAVAAVACADKTGARADSAAPGTSTAAVSAPGGASSGDNDLADIQGYRLTMDKIDKFFAAQRNIALRVKDMSPEEREAMKARGDAEDGADDSMDDMVRKIDEEPALAAGIRDAGLTTREYALITMSMMQSAMAAGVLKTRPKDNQDSLIREMKASPENVRFIQQNEAELQRRQQAMAEEMKRLGVADDS